jgi:hypothetical protein
MREISKIYIKSHIISMNFHEKWFYLFRVYHFLKSLALKLEAIWQKTLRISLFLVAKCIFLLYQVSIYWS